MWITAGAILGFLGVLLGAFGAHGLRSKISTDLLEAFHTGTMYHMYHALAILFCGIFQKIKPENSINQPAIFFSIGIILFSGSLYILAITGVKKWGIVTPFGGLSFLAGWISLAWVSMKVLK